MIGPGHHAVCRNRPNIFCFPGEKVRPAADGSDFTTAATASIITAAAHIITPAICTPVRAIHGPCPPPHSAGNGSTRGIQRRMVSDADIAQNPPSANLKTGAAQQ